MKAVRILCCVIATALIGSFASEAKAHGLVGFYVQQDQFGRGLVITRFIHGTSAHALHLQGDLEVGDIITRYDGRRVHSAGHVRQISAQSWPGTWLRMEFQTPSGASFTNFVMPGDVAASPESPAAAYSFRRGTGRPGSGQGSTGGRPRETGPGAGGTGRPRDNTMGHGRPRDHVQQGRPSGRHIEARRPIGTGRPR